MNMSEMIIDCRRQLNGLDYEFVIWKLINGKYYLAKPLGDFEFTEVDSGMVVEPTLKVPYTMHREMLKAFKIGAEQLGIKTDSEFTLEGELKATKFHLEDMRTLLKVNK